MGRILSIDYGAKRSGIAATDPLRIIASPVTALETQHLIEFLTSYFQQETVDEVVVGWPTQDDGSPTNNTPLVQAFVNRFKKLFPNMPVVLHDEWNTSNMAMSAMIAGGLKKKDRRNKLTIDKVSAVLILQSYLNSKI